MRLSRLPKPLADALADLPYYLAVGLMCIIPLACVTWYLTHIEWVVWTVSGFAVGGYIIHVLERKEGE